METLDASFRNLPFDRILMAPLTHVVVFQLGYTASDDRLLALLAKAIDPAQL